jgi:hypothetical protein
VYSVTIAADCRVIVTGGAFLTVDAVFVSRHEMFGKSNLFTNASIFQMTTQAKTRFIIPMQRRFHALHGKNAVGAVTAHAGGRLRHTVKSGGVFRDFVSSGFSRVAFSAGIGDRRPRKSRRGILYRQYLVRSVAAFAGRHAAFRVNALSVTFDLVA